MWDVVIRQRYILFIPKYAIFADFYQFSALSFLNHLSISQIHSRYPVWSFGSPTFSGSGGRYSLAIPVKKSHPELIVPITYK